MWYHADQCGCTCYCFFLNSSLLDSPLRSDQVNLVYLSLYQQVLCAVQVLAKESTMMSRDTWETLLHFLLRINHAMLSPATAAGDSYPNPLYLYLSLLSISPVCVSPVFLHLSLYFYRWCIRHVDGSAP